MAKWGVGASEGQLLLVTFLVIMIKYLTEAAEGRFLYFLRLTVPEEQAIVKERKVWQSR